MNKKPLKHYIVRFKNVPDKVIEAQYKRNYWMLLVLDKCLDNPKDCYVGFFHFLIYKLHQLGEEATLKVLEARIPLYQFVMEHQRRQDQAEGKAS